MFKLTQDQIGGIVRAIVSAGVGYAAGRGWLGGQDVAAITAAISTLIISIWSSQTNKPA